MNLWYPRDVQTAVDELQSHVSKGLASTQVAKRQEQHGANELVESSGRSPWTIVWEQLSGPMVLLLVIAAIVSAFLGEYKDSAVILAIVVLNAILGFFQDYRAEQAMAALKQLAVPRVRVLRDGQVREISAKELVPGDIVLLEAGNLVPADGRLIEVQTLKIQEAALTGESVPVEKTAEPLSADELPLGDRINLAFMGTVVTNGRGRLLVTDIGMETELGHIAHMLQSVDTESTPLQRRLGELGRGLAIAALGIVAVVFGLGLLQGTEWKLMLMTAMSMAVAAVPEGLPAVATVTLALGARRMFRRNALIRKLPAVETLGSVTVICSDKTGTLTENRMTVTVLEAAGDRVSFQQRLAAADDIKDNREIGLILGVATLCNDAALKKSPTADPTAGEPSTGESPSTPRAVGDPTETAFVTAAAQVGLIKEELEQWVTRVDEVPFESDRKRMTTIHNCPASDASLPADETDSAVVTRTVIEFLQKISGSTANPPSTDEVAPRVALVKGAVDSLLSVSTSVWNNGTVEPLTDEWRQRISAANDDLAGQGMRVLGTACRGLPAAEPRDRWESELMFVGLAAIVDPPRPEVKQAVARCRQAGIRPVMITGDHRLTARTIAKELGIASDDRVVTGTELAKMSDVELDEAALTVSVFARVAPEHKLRIVETLQKAGEVVAMTGDGVNDAPALKRAQIGVAMGIAGTDVSKEASEMVLVDDNFATIVNAVEEGRIVYDNIRKFIKYTMTSNAGEIWVMIFPLLLGVLQISGFADISLPLLPLQILWINLVTDGLPGLALAVEPAERQTMNRPPYPPAENFFGRGMARDILWVGLLMGITSFGLGAWYWFAGGQPSAADGAANDRWRTIVFTTLTLSQMGNAIAIRSSRDSIFQIGLFSNKFMLGSVVLTLVLQLAVTYLEPLQRLFRTTALSAVEMLACIAVSSLVFWAVEAQKWWQRRSDGFSAPQPHAT